MSEARLFATPRFTVYPGESHQHRLSLAVRVIDDVTSSAPSVAVRIQLKAKTNQVVKAIANHSGEYCFRDILDGEYTILVEPDILLDYFYLKPPPQGQWSNNFEVPVTLPLPASPLVEVRLAPKPSYPFSRSVTLIRGKVVQGDKKEGLPGVIVRTQYEQFSGRDQTQRIDIETLTDDKGHFVLFFTRLPKKTQQVVLQAELTGQQSDPMSVTIRESTVAKSEIIFL
ncbi:MAG: hypothetical protein AB7G75_04655 [Candidatus Binatia bacterium]